MCARLQHMPPRFVARQLSRPEGFLGHLIRFLMNRHNARMNAFAVRLLDLAPSDRVLEIGFGGGVALPSLIGRASFVGGVDLAPDVVAWAKNKFAHAVQAGVADFREGSVDAIPFEPASFSKVCTVNTVYFWPSLDSGFAEIRRVLSPGGRAVVGFLPKDRMDRGKFPADIFTSRAPEEVVDALIRAGFQQVRVERPAPSTPWNVIVATR